METLPCNALQATHSKDWISFIFTFEAPDGTSKSVYVSTSPSGAKTLAELAAKEVAAFEKEQQVVVKAWEMKADKPSTEKSKVYIG